jgi:hypothetical protein
MYAGSLDGVTPPVPPKRPATSAGDRDVLVIKTPPRGVGLTAPMPLGIPHEISDAVTGVVPPGPELEEARRKRASSDPAESIAILERKADETKRWQDLYIGVLEEIRNRSTKRDDITFNTEINIRDANEKDRLEGRRDRRKWVGQLVTAGVAGGGIVGAVVAALRYFGVL